MSWRFGARNGVSIGPFAASTLQQQNAVAIGSHAGRHNQGANSIAIGANAGHSNQHQSTIVINASGSAINTQQDNSSYLAPVRLATAPHIMSYNAATKEVTYSSTLNGSLGISNTNVVEFGSGVSGKDGNAGKIGYQPFTTGCLDVVGAGTTGSDRRVRIWDKLGVGANPTNAIFEVAGTSYLSGKTGIGITNTTATLGITNLSADYIGTINLERAIADASIYTVSFNQSDTTNVCGFGMVPKERAIMGPTSYFFGNHITSTAEWGIVSSGWENLFSVRGSSGNVYMKGNVGVGITNPGVKLDVSGDIRGSGSIIGNTHYVSSTSITYNNSADKGKWFKIATLPAKGVAEIGISWSVAGEHGYILLSCGQQFNTTPFIKVNEGNYYGHHIPQQFRLATDNASIYYDSFLEMYLVDTTWYETYIPINVWIVNKPPFNSSVTLITTKTAGTTSGYTYYQVYGYHPLDINWNGARMCLANTGNVGIGTNDPSSKFHLKDGRMDVHTGAARFNGLLGWDDASGRAQIVLSSYYSDLVIASSQANDIHGSTLTFVTTNPSNAGDYRKWVINQGNWGNRRHMLDFGYAANITNPHNAISSSATLLTLDGANMRVGIGSTDPGYKLDVSGDIRATTEIYVNSWFRNIGTGGLWNETYGRGIRCADAEGNNYGNISTHGDGRNGWLGYGIGTRYCFMGKNTGEVGIHDNINSWCIHFNGSRNCTIYGPTTLLSTLNVSGATTLSSTLNVSGITTLSSRLTVGGSITIQNNSNAYEAGCIYTDPNWGMLFRAAVAANIAHMRWDRFDGTTIMKIQNTGVLRFTGGGTDYAVENALTTRQGAVVIGNISNSYGGGWQAGLMMECQDTTEISCHDSGLRLTSFIYYDGANRMYMGRDIGGGVTPVSFKGRVSINGEADTTAQLCITNPNGTISHFGYNNNWNYIRGVHTQVDTSMDVASTLNVASTLDVAGNTRITGLLNIGNTSTNYDVAWSPSILLNCVNRCEIQIHDAGDRLVSGLYYNGGNRLYLGRDIGWGSTPVEIPNNLTVYGGMSVSGGDIYMSGKLIMNSPIDTYWHLNWYYSAYSPGAQLHNSTGTWQVSIWTSGAIVTTYWFGTVSDKRVKTNISPINNALSIIKKIEVVSFDYIDAINNKRDECGIIAQQLEEVFPNAVDKTTGIIPNIMKKVTSFYKNNNILTLYYTRNDTEENLLVGSRVKLILGVYGSSPENGFKKGGEYVVVVKNVESEYISVEWTREFSLLELSIFIYGKEVDDLRNVDKEQLGILSLRGIQELCENNDRLEMRINQLEENNMILNTINKDQQDKLDKLQKDIDTLTSLVNQLINK